MKKCLYRFWTIDPDTFKKKDGTKWMTLPEVVEFFNDKKNDMFVIEQHKYVDVKENEK